MRVPSSPAKNTCHKAATSWPKHHLRGTCPKIEAPSPHRHATFVATIIEHPPENNIIFSRSQRKSATKFHRGGQNRCRSLTIDLRFQENINRLRSIQKINIDSQIESRLGKERLRRRSWTDSGLIWRKNRRKDGAVRAIAFPETKAGETGAVRITVSWKRKLAMVV